MHFWRHIALHPYVHLGTLNITVPHIAEREEFLVYKHYVTYVRTSQYVFALLVMEWFQLSSLLRAANPVCDVLIA